VPFTERERCFIQLLCGPDEFTYEQVADRMGVHRRTVDGYREAVFAKAGVHTKAGLVLFAVHYGLVAL
jgi:DNA-binding CsgD family transcriptional regulator